MCVYLLKLNLYYAIFRNLVNDVLLHDSELNQTIRKYYYKLLLHIILLFVTNQGGYHVPCLMLTKELTA